MSVFYFENRHYPNWVRFRDLGRELSFGHPRGVAYERNNFFFATGLNNGGEAIAARNTGVTITDWIAQTFGDASPVESDNEPGVRYRRIARPSTLGATAAVGMEDKLNDSFVALRILLRKLDELFETIEPTPANARTYGHKIRDVLLLACMEVESSWTAVLRGNGYTNSIGRFTTNDYVKLFQPMLLDGYELHLQSYGLFPAFVPYGSWDINNPTTSLSWYDAYNKTKHDREGNLHYATLENAIHAVGAAIVIFYAQFGFHFGTGLLDQKTPVIREIFRLTRVGFERHEREFYIPLFTITPPQQNLWADSGSGSRPSV
jgi:hypothetical protein